MSTDIGRWRAIKHRTALRKKYFRAKAISILDRLRLVLINYASISMSVYMYIYADIYLQAAVDTVQEVCGNPEDRPASLMLSLGPFYHMVLSNMSLAMEGKGELGIRHESKHGCQ